MTDPPDAPPRQSFADALAVYLKPRVLIVLLLGFSSGLPLALPARRWRCGDRNPH